MKGTLAGGISPVKGVTSEGCATPSPLLSFHCELAPRAVAGNSRQFFSSSFKMAGSASSAM